MQTERRKYHKDLIFSNLFYGINFSFMVSLVQHWISFRTLFFMQVFVSALFFIPFALFSRRYRMQWGDFGRIFLVTLLVVYGGMYMLLWGAAYTNPIDASIIATLGPAFTLITASILVKKETMSTVRLIGILLSLAGAAALFFDRGGVLIHGSEAFGNLLVLISVISVAINTVIIKPVLEKVGTLVVMGWYYIIGLLLTAPFFAREMFTTEYHTLPYGAMLEILYILILGTVLPSYLLYRGTEKLTPVHTALYRYIQPVVATSLALWRGQEQLDRTNIVAAILIFLGIVLVVAAYENVVLRIRRFWQRHFTSTGRSVVQDSSVVPSADPLPSSTVQQIPATPSAKNSGGGAT